VKKIFDFVNIVEFSYDIESKFGVYDVHFLFLMYAVADPAILARGGELRGDKVGGAWAVPLSRKLGIFLCTFKYCF